MTIEQGRIIANLFSFKLPKKLAKVLSSFNILHITNEALNNPQMQNELIKLISKGNLVVPVDDGLVVFNIESVSQKKLSKFVSDI